MLQLHKALASCTLTVGLQDGGPGFPPSPPPVHPRTRTNHRTREGAGDHVSISPERDTLPRGPAVGPRSGNGTSRRDPPQSTVTIQGVGLILLTCVCFGMLLGTAWTVQATQPKLRRQAEERRRLNAEWQAVRHAQHSTQLIRCPRCGYPLSGALYFEDDEPDDDD
jgi:hypothetical protein